MTDTPDTHDDTWTPAPDAEPSAPAPAPIAMPASGRPASVLRRRAATVATLTGLTIGGIAGGYIISQAASPSPSPTGSPSTEPGSGFPGAHHGGPGMRGNRDEDLQVAAGAIGISLSQLQTELQGGRSIAAVAKAHNVDASKVIDALVASENKEVDAALGAGRITQAQADQMKADQRQRVTDMVNGVRPQGGPDGHGGPGMHGLAQEDLSVVAGAIGISAGDLQTALSGGQTIAAVARAHGVDAAKVISAWTASENQEIDALAKAGRITQSQADQMKAMTQQRVTDMVNGTFRGGPHGGFRGGPGGPGGPGLAPGSTQSSTDTSA
jgi:hypothetical protein